MYQAKRVLWYGLQARHHSQHQSCGSPRKASVRVRVPASFNLNEVAWGLDSFECDSEHVGDGDGHLLARQRSLRAHEDYLEFRQAPRIQHSVLAESDVDRERELWDQLWAVLKARAARNHHRCHKAILNDHQGAQHQLLGFWDSKHASQLLNWEETL